MNEYVVYVLDINSEPLMPTKRFGKVRRMLKAGKAIVKHRKPFTIQLTYESKTHITQPVCLGIDPGRTNIGLSAECNGRCLYNARCTTNNKDVPKHMQDRKQHRQASRKGRRDRRKRRAKKNGTLMNSKKKNVKVENSRPIRERKLPQCVEVIVIKDIINKESRFCNRNRLDGWLTPTATHLLRTHLNLIKKVCKILPISCIVIEINKFAFMKMDNPNIQKCDYQNGALKGYAKLEDAVYKLQNGKCLICGCNEIDHYHHMLPRSQDGSDTVENIVGLCTSCHDRVHKDAKTKAKLATLHGQRNKKYAALSGLNQIIPFLIDEIETMFPGHVFVTNGYITKEFRDKYMLTKSHEMDSYCIAMSRYRDNVPSITKVFPKIYEIQQFRRHNRAIVQSQKERTYKYNGKTVAKNKHKRMEQFCDSLEEWYNEQVEKYGVKRADKMRSQLIVVPSKRSYNNLDRVLPGAIFQYNSQQHVLTGQRTNGQYYLTRDDSRNYPAKKSDILLHNTGLVYM